MRMAARNATLFHKEGFSAFDAVVVAAGGAIVFCVGRYFRAPGLPASQIAVINEDGSGSARWRMMA